MKTAFVLLLGAMMGLTASDADAQPDQGRRGETVRAKRAENAAQPSSDVRRAERVKAKRAAKRVRKLGKAIRKNSGAFQLLPKSGPPGTTVTIRGPGIRDASKIRIGRQQVGTAAVGKGVVTFVVPETVKAGKRPVSILGPDTVTPVGIFEITTAGTASEDPHRRARPRAHASSMGHEDHEHATVHGDLRRNHRVIARRRWRKKGMPVVSSMSPQKGPVGTRVVIYGENFPEDGQLSIGGLPLKKQFVAPHKISFPVPQGAKGGFVTLESPSLRHKLWIGRFDVDGFDWKAERKKRRAEWRKAAEKNWRKRGKAWGKKREERIAQRKQREAELAASRAERRAKRLAKLQARFEAAFLADIQTRHELALHAERRAKMQRMQRLAESLNKGKLVVRIDVAIHREDRRHERRMNNLKEAFARK